MIDWRDDGTVLGMRRHGETSAILEVFTPCHGRHAGLVRGGGGRRSASLLQPGNRVALTWRARLEDHLGTFTVEPIRSRAAALSDPLSLAGLGAVTGLLLTVLADRDPHPALHDRTEALLDLLGDAALWPLGYLQWEMALLEELGVGLDLDRCAVTGTTVDLVYVSPRSGRAVSATGAGDWASRLLPLPPVLRGQGEATGPQIAVALATTGWFLEHRLLNGDRSLPAARQRLVDRIARIA